MKAASIMMALLSLLFIKCSDKSDDHASHGASDLEPLAYTIYTDKTELFVEFKPLVVGEVSKFAAHFTILGENFLPLEAGNVTVSLIIGETGIRHRATSASSPGIFRLALSPTKPGLGKLVFDIETKDYTDQIIIENIEVHADQKKALVKHADHSGGDEISYLKEQAWKVEFANMVVVKQPFTDIIRANGQILSAPGDETVVTATTAGSVAFLNKNAIVGSKVNVGAALFSISGGNINTGTVEASYKEAKANYDKAKADFDRSKELVDVNIISQKEYIQAKVDFENAQTIFNSISKNYSAKGQNVFAAKSGFVKSVLVAEGQYVEPGTPMMVISKNKKLILQANVSQRYFEKLSTVSSANFKTTGSSEVFSTEELNGKVISFGKSAVANSPFIPISFEIDNIGNLVSGIYADVYLKSSPIPDALTIPISALLEEQGKFYVYVQSSGEGFLKREVSLGATDGITVQLLSGVSEGERVVTKGAYQIKLSSASGALPAHGHEH